MASALLGPADIRALADALGIRPTKRLGQNFLHDANTIRRIVRTAELQPGERVLEVGPGLGSLTLGLLEAGHPVTAVEIDPVLAAALPATVSARLPDAPLTVVQADALRYHPDEPRTAPTVDLNPRHAREGDAEARTISMVANLPYNVAVPVVLHLLEVLPALRAGLVLVQAEVADRLAAPPGSRVYGVPSVKTAWYASASRAGAVSRTVFWPVPNVDSGLVRLVRRDPPATSASRAEVFAVVDAAFAQRRKMLRSSLAGWAGSAAAAETALRAAGVDPSARGETLSVTQFAHIAQNRPPFPTP
ncbi:MAG TPA: 16S rRNA (adenine(1518)-N(6)/adenine(1519)-N(6))-dimethyltransferase RsmA [Jatrophihabitantaceae bacterium]|nr:16S rRNA (adenine(1518)-N(6)/adenine(1519)-N(6))-dimethyltransferase RsmA [Jatrophihabitantaceae bacterium]